MSDRSPNRRSRWLITRAGVKRLVVLAVLIAAFLVWAYFSMIRMPGTSHRGPLPPLTEAQAALSAELKADVQMIAETIGPRDLVGRPKALNTAADWIESALSAAEYRVQRQSFEVYGSQARNIEVEITGASRPGEIVVVGAHYDSVVGCPAANDNGSGVAATLALARRFAPPAAAPARTLRFVLFVNEEPPYFQTEDMGSLVYARRCRQRNENVVAMLSLETIGCYSDAPGSQTYPIKGIDRLYPKTGNFIAFVGNWSSRGLVRQAIGGFRARAQLPSEGAALPGWIAGVGWSDHWSFWQEGYPALMVTDTALFRYSPYHTPGDTPEKLDYDRMARVVEGLEDVVRVLATPP